MAGAAISGGHHIVREVRTVNVVVSFTPRTIDTILHRSESSWTRGRFVFVRFKVRDGDVVARGR